ncbi:MAG: hypothetical protein ACI9D5_002805 [Candidatus Endobugula sp.]|jgi:hypothetical protein
MQKIKSVILFCNANFLQCQFFAMPVLTDSKIVTGSGTLEYSRPWYSIELRVRVLLATVILFEIACFYVGFF